MDVQLSATEARTKYRLVHRIAAGGMGEVFLAKQEGPAGFVKTVVVKRILDHLASDEHFVQMFLDEARLAALLSHPNIVQIFELGTSDNTYFIAMEYIEGQSLRAIMRRLKSKRISFNPVLVAKIASQVLRGLGYAHELKDSESHPLKIVHRDVSPDNVLVGINGSVKLADFGIAKATAAKSTTQSGLLKGKFHYIAPEIIKGAAADFRSDIYSMGVVIYEALAGERPFVGSNDGELFRLIVEAEPAALTQRNKNIPEALSRIVMRALSKDPRSRFQSAEAMGSALDAFIESTGQHIHETHIRSFLRDQFPAESGGETVGATESEAEAFVPLTDIEELDIVVDSHQFARPVEIERQCQLVVLNLHLAGDVFRLDRSPTFVGRSSANDVSIDHPSLLDARCMLYLNEASHWMVTDLSGRGLLVNGDRIERAQLRRGDVLSLGEIQVLFSTITGGSQESKSTPSKFGPPAGGIATPSHRVETPSFKRSTTGMALVRGQTVESAYGGHFEVQSFWIDQTPVTNAAYLAFIEATGELPPAHWIGRKPPSTEMNHPVVGVNLDAARHFARWRGCRLPTNIEWEVAARGPELLGFPWGNLWDEAKAVGPELGLSGPLPVGSRPLGATRSGIVDMVGNVWEWTELASGVDEPDFGYVWVFGGSYLQSGNDGGRIARQFVAAEKEYRYLGFRCVREAM